MLPGLNGIEIRVRKGPLSQTLTPTLSDLRRPARQGSFSGTQASGHKLPTLGQESPPNRMLEEGRGMGELGPSFLLAEGNKLAQWLLCAESVGLELARAGRVRFCAMWCPQGSCRGTQCMPDFGELAGRGLSRRPLPKAVRLCMWQLRAKQEMEALGSKGLDSAQHHVHPTLMVKGIPGLPGSREGQRPVS